MDKVRSACPEVRWSGHYSLPGPYDAWTVETWSARPYERLLEVLDEVEG